MLATNQRLHKGRYRIINAFNQDENGGMYEAYDTVSNTNVVLRESFGGRGDAATSTQLEEINEAFAGGAKVLAEIRHESLVSIQDYFSEIDRQYLVLEAVTGSDLSKFLQPEEQKPILTDVLSWAEQLLNALDYIHRLSPPLIHKDIRPENIKLTSGSKVKLLTAAIAEHSAEGVLANVSGESTMNTSLHYRSLEQLWPELNPASQRVILNSYDEKGAGLLMQAMDARSDLYSMSASLYHVLTGTPPCDALDRSIAILDGNADPLKPLSDLDNNIPSEISEIFMRAMAIHREDRFESATVMLQDLRSAKARVWESEIMGAEMPVEPHDQAFVDTHAPTGAYDSGLQTEIESAEATLLQEQNNAEDRQLELKAEQTRLEEEQKLFEQRRNELEAEKERIRAAKKLAEFEAEQARQHAEQERIEAEAKQELERAEQAGKEFLDLKPESSGTDTQDDEQNLLEITAVPAFGPAAENFELLEDELFQEEETSKTNTATNAYENSAAAKKESFLSDKVTDDFSIDDLTKTSATGWRVPVVAVAAVLLLGVAFGAWMFLSGVDAPAPTPPVQTSLQADQPLQTTVSDNQPVADSTLTADSVTNSDTQPAVVEPARTAEKNRQLQLSAAQDKLKKPAPSPAKTPEPKKKVTVDDLINDN